MSNLLDPRQHPDWLEPHSLPWYARLGQTNGRYSYPWNSTISEPNGETIFTNEVAAMVVGKRVLDVGCGHGEYAISWSPVAKEVVGLDVTDSFLQAAREAKPDNVSFVVANARRPIPFEVQEFDCAYIRRGPGSAYADLKRVIRPGGKILGLHPGDGCNAELAEYFPTLFAQPAAGHPTMDNIQSYLRQGDLDNAEVEVITSVEYFTAPEDILKVCCFGQGLALYHDLVAQWLPSVNKTFQQHATVLGFPTTFIRYIVRARV